MQFSIKLEFIIDKKGGLARVGIVNKKEREYTEEENMIVDILKSSPKWEPGMCSGKEVNVLLKMKLRFVVNENGKLI